MNTWEYYSGDTETGPYGYYKGYFVNWILSEFKEVNFILKSDRQANEQTEKEIVFRFVSKWLTEQLSYTNSLPLNQIKTAFLYLKRD